MKLKKVISGGQTGADLAGLKAAKAYGLCTGGHCPKNCWTERGANLDLVKMYGLVEHTSPKYPPRTYANAKNSDGTVRFYVDATSAGEICTKKAVDQYDKPLFDVYMHKPPPSDEMVKWILDNNIETLNVAGHRESSCPGIETYVTKYLTVVFRKLEKHENQV